MDKPYVLVVDDEIDARETVINFLKARYDCEFAEANDGEEAVEYLKSNPCHFIILDIKMPKKSGINVIKEAKELDPNIDILIVSAWINEDLAEEATKLGAADYISKPIDLNAMSLKFENIFKKKGIQVRKRQF